MGEAHAGRVGCRGATLRPPLSPPNPLQVHLFRRADVLVGIHGSGLINTQFMRKGTSLLQLMPYKVRRVTDGPRG